MSDKTRIDVTFGVQIAGVECPLTASVISGEKTSWAFSGSAEKLGSLRDLINRLYAQMTGESREVFDSRIFPPVDFSELSFEFGGEPAHFIVRSSFANLGIVKSLAFTFARLDGSGGASPRYLVGLCTDASLDLVDIAGSGGGELIKQLLGNVSLDRLGLYYASDQIDDVAFFRASPERQRFAKGPSLSVRFGTATSHVDLVLPPPKQASPGTGGATSLPSPALPSPALPSPAPPSSAPPSSAPPSGLPAPAPAADQPAGPLEPKPPVAKLPDAPFRFWKDVDKTLGPLQLRRIGGEWDGKNSTIGILLDSSIELAGLKVGLAGLCVKVPPSKLTSLKFADLQFGLDGLELSFQRGPVAISGALLRTRDGDQVGYAGMASIRAASFAIGAIGAYTSIQNQPSFFIFGAYSGILGGPPFFIVTGIAAGFGYNRGIALPDLDELRDFPLISLVLGPSPGSTSAKSMLDQLGTSNRFPATAGQHWIAAGVKFSSFKLIDAFALVTVQFGTRFEIALLGIATLQQPPVPRPFLCVELVLKLRFAPDDGLLSLTAGLTASSYLFDTRCKLTGGLALCIWFNPTNPKISKEHVGDFVLSIGGYHPKFKVPAHYPRVPRVGFDWQLPEWGVVIKGEAYFALTTSCIMVGGRLSVLFRAGPIRAWFEAYADVLIGWAPFHYDIAIGVRIGVAFVMDFGAVSTALSFELGAALQLWGPPFAGEVYVSLGFISFTVPIGDRSASRTATPLTWPQFASTFLPLDDRTPGQQKYRPLRVSIVAGIVSEHKSADPGIERYVIVNGADLLVSAESLVPVTTLQADILPGVTGTTRELGIRPMGRPSLDAKLKLSCTRRVSDGSAPVPQQMVSKPILKNLPEALWSPTPVPDARLQNEISSRVIENCLMGVQLMPADDHRPAEHRVSLDVHPITLTVKKPAKSGASPASYDDDADTAGDGPFERFRAALGRPAVPAAREDVLTALRGCGFDLPEDAIHLSGPAGTPELADVLLAAPWLVKIGELLPLPPGA